VRQTLESEAQKRESEECSFQPVLFTKPRRSKSSEGDRGARVFEDLYEQRETQAAKKQSLAAKYFIEESASFHPNIPQRSARLADKRRRKKFCGAAIHSSVPTQGPGQGGLLEVEIRDEEEDRDEDYHSAREGGGGAGAGTGAEDLWSRRSSLETIPSPTGPSVALAAEVVDNDRPIAPEKETSFPSPSSVPIPPRRRTSESGLSRPPSLFDTLYEVSPLICRPLLPFPLLTFAS
jgi:hypothetical protein